MKFVIILYLITIINSASFIEAKEKFSEVKVPTLDVFFFQNGKKINADKLTHNYYTIFDLKKDKQKNKKNPFIKAIINSQDDFIKKYKVKENLKKYAHITLPEIDFQKYTLLGNWAKIKGDKFIKSVFRDDNRKLYRYIMKLTPYTYYSFESSYALNLVLIPKIKKNYKVEFVIINAKNKIIKEDLHNNGKISKPKIVSQKDLSKDVKELFKKHNIGIHKSNK